MGEGEILTDPAGFIPALPLLSSVVFPHDVVSVQLSEDAAAGALEALKKAADPILATAPGGPDADYGPEESEICVLCRVVQRMRMPAGGVQVVFQGLGRARVTEERILDSVRMVRVTALPDGSVETPETRERVLAVLDLIGDYLARDGTYPDDLESILRMNLRGVGRFADLAGAYLHLPLPVKRELALTAEVESRLDLLTEALGTELARFSVESDIHRRVRDQIDERQREQYLRQQMRAIRRELGDASSPEADCDALGERLATAGLSKEAREVAEREIRRLRGVAPSSAEYQVIRTYVGWLLDCPWKKRTRDRLDLDRARAALDEHHHGLDRVKERILEHLAVRKLNRNRRGPILCLVGPPGVGKTTLGRSVAKALGRRFVRMSVGGLRDESEIKGHRRTYVGAMPGKVVQLMRRAGVRNPVLLIDEIEKMGADHRGDPASAVLEVLDPECNAEFRDHYLDVGFDLSEVFFLLTANLLDTIPPPLLDRLEVLRIGGYTRAEKLQIAKKHLVLRAIRETGLRKSRIRFTRDGLEYILDRYTREAGLREFERALRTICRKTAMRWVRGDRSPVRVGPQEAAAFLGPARYRPLLAGRRPEVGVATGLAWTAHGGATLSIEATRMPGKGTILVTGRLGEVMRESAQTALSYVRAHCAAYTIDPDLFKGTDIHIHFPEGATPKDGPSAGVAIATCLASLFTGRPVRHDLAMTGEITLTGKVLEVGGIKEKLLAAHRAGLRTVLIPEDNRKDLEELPEEVLEDLEILATEDVEANICEALLEAPRCAQALSPGIAAEADAHQSVRP